MKVINRHLEWVVLLTGLVLMAFLNPYSTETSWCLIDLLGFSYCPGAGLGHSIAFLFRGEIINSLEANLMGPIAVVVLSLRVINIWKNLIVTHNSDLMENYHA